MKSNLNVFLKGCCFQNIKDPNTLDISSLLTRTKTSLEAKSIQVAIFSLHTGLNFSIKHYWELIILEILESGNLI